MDGAIPRPRSPPPARRRGRWPRSTSPNAGCRRRAGWSARARSSWRRSRPAPDSRGYRASRCNMARRGRFTVRARRVVIDLAVLHVDADGAAETAHIGVLGGVDDVEALIGPVRQTVAGRRRVDEADVEVGELEPRQVDRPDLLELRGRRERREGRGGQQREADGRSGRRGMILQGGVPVCAGSRGMKGQGRRGVSRRRWREARNQCLSCRANAPPLKYHTDGHFGVCARARGSYRRLSWTDWTIGRPGWTKFSCGGR